MRTWMVNSPSPFGVTVILPAPSHRARLPRVPRFLGNLHAGAVHLDIRRVAHKQVDVQVVALLRIHIARDGSQEARDVSRTTGAAEPWAALVLATRLQWIRIEEALAVQRDAAHKPAG